MELNKIFTIKYSQPKEYHFSLDSIFLPQRINDWLLQEKIYPIDIVDVCSGSGVVGLELLFHLSKRNSAPKKIDFIEIQDNYRIHFETNKKTMLSLLNLTTNLTMSIENYEKLIDDPAQKEKYDLIVSNPPYFHVGQGKLAPVEFKNRCRHFVDSDLAHLFKWFCFAMKPEASAFLLVRTDNTTTLAEVERLANQNGLAMELLGEIRGSEFLRMSRLKSLGS